MKGKNKNKRLRKIVIFFRNNKWPYVLLCLVTVIIICGVNFICHIRDEQFSLMEYLTSLIEVKTYVSIVLAFALSGIAEIIMNYAGNKIEDFMKLTTDYDKLSAKYNTFNSLLTYQNQDFAPYKIGRKNTKSLPKNYDKNKQLYTSQRDEYTFPITVLGSLYDKSTTVDFTFNKKHYKLPEWANSHSDELFAAHAHSKIYNQENLRADNFEVDGKNATIFLSQTSYFNSLITNRACDYEINGVSIRELYEPGPYLRELKDSELSNHLGFNGMVETSDNKFILIKRHGKVSIAKNTLQSSVGASLKVRYALDQNKEVTKQGIARAIVKEIVEEFNLFNLENHDAIEEEMMKTFSFEKNILYFYRDFLECGKPQLMFYYKMPLTSTEVAQAFTKGIGKARKKKDSYALYNSIDGYKMIFVERENLSKLYLCPDGIVINKRFFKSVPSAVATLIMLRRYMDENGNS